MNVVSSVSGNVAEAIKRHNISLMRHNVTTGYDPKPGVSVATLSYEYPSGYRVLEHAHGADQLIYATRGVMEVSVGMSLWLIPPQFAIWIPGRTWHSIRMPGAVSMRTLYLRRGLAARMPARCTVLHISPLLRELIVEAVHMGRLRSRNRLHSALGDLIVSRLESASPIPTFVTMPKDPRALAVAQMLLANLAATLPLRALCASAGASVRTIERAFQRDLGLNLEQWRRQARLMKAVELLVARRSIKEVAFEVGYRQPSAFVEMFRQSLGMTPRAWTVTLEQSSR